MFWSLFIGFLSAILSGVILRFWFEILNEKYLKPVRDYRVFKRKVASALLMFAREISMKAPIPTDGSFPLSERHLIAGQSFRSLAAELEGITYSFPESKKDAKEPSLVRKRFSQVKSIIRRDVPSEISLRNAVSSLVGLSNSFFLPVGRKYDDDIGYEMNLRRVKEIRELIGLRPDNDIERELAKN